MGGICSAWSAVPVVLYITLLGSTQDYKQGGGSKRGCMIQCSTQYSTQCFSQINRYWGSSTKYTSTCIKVLQIVSLLHRHLVYEESYIVQKDR